MLGRQTSTTRKVVLDDMFIPFLLYELDCDQLSELWVFINLHVIGNIVFFIYLSDNFLHKEGLTKMSFL